MKLTVLTDEHASTCVHRGEVESNPTIGGFEHA